MIITTVAGNVGKDSEIRQAGGSNVLSFSVAGTAGFGDRKQTIWFNCSMWGQRGERLQQYIRKGTKLTVVGEMSTREHEGKTYHELNVMSVELQDSRDSGGGQQQAPAQQQRSAAPQATAPADSGGFDDFDEDVPFADPYRGKRSLLV